MIIVISGVAGVGKTTVGRALAASLGWAFYDADDLHRPEDRERMRLGEGLTDALREPWLERVRTVLVDVSRRGSNAVVACSALKARYRDQLTRDLPGVRFVFLTADATVLRDRLDRRTDHFAGATLLASQLDAVELPDDASIFDAALPVDTLVERIRASMT
jgi:carbohydrate kinase (thermoresistant glucokinase family)